MVKARYESNGKDSLSTTDVIVIGAGGAGLVAAMAAADEGAAVVQFEKTDRIGGCWLPGIGNAGSTAGAQAAIQIESGILDDSPNRFYADCMRDARARAVCSPEVLSYYCRHAGFAVDWLDRLGAFSKRERRARGGLFGEPWTILRSYFMNPDFLEVVAAAHRQRVARGDIRLLMQAKVTSLVFRRGVVTGVVAEIGGFTRTWEARSVIVATGGFASDTEMVRRYNLPGAAVITTAAMPFSTGDGLNLCREIGVQMVNLGSTMVMGPFLGGIPDPSRPSRELGLVNIGCPGVVLVNSDGRRFINEDCGRTNPGLRDAMLRFPGHQVVAVFDHGTLVGSEPVVTGRTAEWLLDKAAVGLAVRKASSVSDLASLAGLDPAALSVTLERWNRQVAVGADSDFGRIGVLRPVVAPPYYAISLGVRVVASSGGPKTNTRQQVIDDNDRIIPGLFAAGEVTGYQGYGTGMFNTGCVVFGRQAGRMAASYALGRSLPLSP